jgi:ribonuclease HI
VVVNQEPPVFDEFELCFPGLRQLINRFELAAIRRAQEIAKDRGLSNVEIFSDSRVAVGWAKANNVFWTRRDKNLAGIVLEAQTA